MSFSSTIGALRSLVPKLSPSESPSQLPLDLPQPTIQCVVPTDILAYICVKIIEHNNSPWAIGDFALVCRRWYRAARTDIVWDYIIRQYFVAFPLLRAIELPSAQSAQLRSIASEGLASRRGTSPVPIFPDPKLESMRRNAPKYEDAITCIHLLAEHRFNVEKKLEVEDHHGFVLNMIVGFALGCLTLFILKAILLGEGFIDTDINHVFVWLWLTYAFVFTAIVGNIVMTAHYEPQPLFSRVSRHLHLIMLSMAALVVSALCVALPTALIQRNWSAPVSERLSWIWCLSPVHVAFVGWQIGVVYSTRQGIRDWMQNLVFGPSELYYLIAYMTPTMFNAAVYSLGQYFTSKSSTDLILGTLPFLLAIGTVMVVFTLDYAARRQSVDGLAALCLFSMMLTPISLLIWEPRGYSFTPMFASALGFFATHVSEFRRKVRDKEHSD